MIAVLYAAVVFLAWKYVHRMERDLTLLVTGAALLLYLIGASLVWVHYLVLLLPLVLVLLGDPGSAGRRILALAGFLFLGSSAWRPSTVAGEARLYWMGMLAVLVALLWRFSKQENRTPRRRRASTR